jgi:conjugative coupling factor TraD (TOL family)
VSRHVIDVLLRPPVELWTSLVAFLCAAVAMMAPAVLLLPQELGLIVAAGMLLLGAWRGHQAYRAMRYQWRLKRLHPYRIGAKRIPLSQHKLYLGRGFAWRQRHTQRLRDTLRPELHRYVAPGRLYRWARRKETAWEHRLYLRWVARWLRQPRLNPLAPLPSIGGNPALHGVGLYEQDVWMNLDERVGHTLVLGTTRVGKTRLAELLIAQDIRRGDVVIVIDPKGDANLLKRVYTEAAAAGRLSDLVIFHLGFPELSARYNAIGRFSRITEVATRIANQLPSEGNSAAFKEFAWRFVNIIARALVSLGEQPNFERIRRYINDIEPLFIRYARYWLSANGDDDWQQSVESLATKVSNRNVPQAMRGRQNDAIGLYQYLQRRGIYEPVLDGLMSTFKYDRSYFDKIVGSVGPLLEKLCSGAVAELLSPRVGDQRPILDWMDVARRRGIVYVGLDALSDTTVAGAVGNAMFADLVSVAGYIYKHGLGNDREAVPTISLHADEFNELIGDEFVPLLNKAGGAGFQVTAYTQTWSDVEARLGDRAKAGQVAGNFNSLIMMRVKEPATAEMLTAQLPTVDVLSLMSVSAVDDSSEPGSGVDFRSRNEDRISVSEVNLLGVSDLVTLPKGQAYALLAGGQLWKIRVPLIGSSKQTALPQSLQAMTAQMTRQYVSNDHWYRHEDRWWIPVGPAVEDHDRHDKDKSD